MWIDWSLTLLTALLINTYALAVHFNFFVQTNIYETDLLNRYRAYANEMVCAADNQIPIE